MVKTADIQDLETVARLASLLWPHHSPEELLPELEESMARGTACCFLKWTEGESVGFAQCGLRRDYVEGTETSPAGYLEGIYVKEEHRGKGYARELLTACEAWARDRGCREFASDCELENRESILFHRAVGFGEANRIVCFAKKL